MYDNPDFYNNSLLFQEFTKNKCLCTLERKVETNFGI